MYTFTGSGLMSPIWITLSGLSDSKLPTVTCPSEILHVEVEGLTVNGGGVTPGSKGIGHIVFVQNDGDSQTNKKRVRYYCNSITLPFVELLQNKIKEWSVGEEISEDMNVRLWQDSDIAQVAVLTLTSTINKFNENKIGAIKH